ncbi:hypothetical protein [Tropicibacter naphthalenivorans]|uniref:Glycosyl transferase family 28 C-terminal domain-containing protein n=1 Tax=Tropicibacter naphthalenivorans TaxID=441103 RepID=A0A0P1GKY4_9RHOB|nr:hypothetical protein [Tropicibacter naphthalenivorans]CUH82685.1 hypothetical protein TRN7648_04228 [Tropicibacter naphthalenivorans]SMD11164.1 Predicted glycosyl transferase [Tropicibacter naphthalenivorans]
MAEPQRVPHRLFALPDDPMAGLLGAWLDLQGGVVPGDMGSAVQDGDWFATQSLFLAAVPRLAGVSGVLNVVLRRPNMREQSDAPVLALEVQILARAAALLPAVMVKWWAASEVAAAAFAAQGMDVRVLPTSHREDAPVWQARLGADGRFALERGPQGGALAQEAVNWARLARDYRLVAQDGIGADRQDMADLANRLPVVPASADLLFITPNGVGLGHLTRQLAVARALCQQLPAPPRITFWSFSQAAVIAQAAGFDVILRHTAEALGADPQVWTAHETAALAQQIRHDRPAAVITDGNRIERFVSDALRQPGCHHPRLIWIRRGMWRADAETGGLADVRYCDEVLIPGDLAQAADKGATARPNAFDTGLSRETVTAPVVLHATEPPKKRRAARRALGLRRGPACLVSLGGEAFARTAILHDKLVHAARATGVRLVWAQSPLAARGWTDVQEERHISRYPISPWLAAFDGVISACGYNSFHELMLLYDGPVLLVPTTNERLDDQAARAGHALTQGWASVLDHETGEAEDARLRAFLAGLAKPAVQKRPRIEACGATQMAERITACLSSAPKESPAP